MQQLLGTALGIGRAGDADAHRALEPLVTDLEGTMTGVDDPVRHLDGLVFVDHVLGHDHELVASEASQRVRRTEVVRQALGHLQQHAVADVVAERVVDHLEPVEIEVQHGQAAVTSGESAQPVLQPVDEHRSVRHAR